MNQHVPSLDYVKERSLHFAELLPDRLYFSTLSDVNLKGLIKKSHANVHYLFVDNEFVYQPFNQDFGPLNLGLLYIYCKKINTIYKKKNIIIHLTSIEKEKRANAAFLIGAYCIIYHQLSPNEVSKRLKDLSTSYLAYKNFAPFVHAGFDACRYLLSIEDCFEAINKALKCNFLDFSTFSLKNYQFYEKVENGDLNWIVPNKFIAFCDPQTYSGSSNNSIDSYVNYFRENNITSIIRLNKSTYDAKKFVSKGFKHYDLIFLDGSAPSDHIVKQFLTICESSSGAIAVHCKAGLGRTGTLIACYLLKHYRFTAPEATAWIRICRPGSIIGYQQKWLQRMQSILWCQGDLHAENKTRNDLNSNTTNNRNTSNENDRVNNNNLTINVVKCHISSTANKDYVNNLNNANQSIDNNCKINKLISELENIDFNDALSIKPRLPINRNVFTQGDYLNEIKLNRKMHANMSINCPSSTCNLTSKSNQRTTSGFAHAANSTRVVKLDPNNNVAEHTNSDNSVDSALKLYGKKMTKYPSIVSKVLPH